MLPVYNRELDAAIPLLPDVTGQVGKIDKGVVLAMKSRVLLYYASPLFNPANDANLWKQAADAAKEVLKI